MLLMVLSSSFPVALISLQITFFLMDLNYFTSTDMP